MEIKLEIINRLLHVDGTNVKALDVIDSVPRDTLQNVVTYVVTCLQESK